MHHQPTHLGSRTGCSHTLFRSGARPRHGHRLQQGPRGQGQCIQAGQARNERASNWKGQKTGMWQEVPARMRRCTMTSICPLPREAPPAATISSQPEARGGAANCQGAIILPPPIASLNRWLARSLASAHTLSTVGQQCQLARRVLDVHASGEGEVVARHRFRHVQLPAWAVVSAGVRREEGSDRLSGSPMGWLSAIHSNCCRLA